MKLKFAIGLFILATLNVHHSHASHCGVEFSNLSRTQNSFYDRFFPSMFNLFTNARNSENLIDAAYSMYRPHGSQQDKIEIMRAISEQFASHREKADSLKNDLSSLLGRNNNEAADLQNCLEKRDLQKCEPILMEGYSDHIKIVGSSLELARKDSESFGEMVSKTDTLVRQLQNGQIVDYRPGITEAKAISVSIQESFTVYREVVESSRRPEEFQRKMAECLAN
jgi:hypothetical protein